MTTRIFVLSALWLLSFTSDGWCQSEASIRLGSFQIDATIPTGHRCMGVLPQKSKSISDSLELHGFVLLGHERPIVIVAIDWCEIRNRSYDLWRERLAKAVGTDPSRVLVSCLHQHDAPVIDHGAQELLDSVELSGELFDNAFHESVLKRAEEAARDALQSSVEIGRAHV